MATFQGVKKYQDYCREFVSNNGYILMNPVVGHKWHILEGSALVDLATHQRDPDWRNIYWSKVKYDPYDEVVMNVKKLNKIKSSYERQSINSRIQNRGACCFKLAMIKLFNWIVTNNYLNIVKICVCPYDELNLECPEEIKDEVADVLKKCMIEGGKPFCTRVHLGADVEIAQHWVH